MNARSLVLTVEKLTVYLSRYCDRVICFNQTIVADDTPIAALSQENLLATYNPTTPKSLQHQTFNFDYN